MRKFSVPIFIVMMGFVCICSNVPTVKAQDTVDYEFTLEEITVTAQKREENQQKVAVAMDVLTGEDITGIGKNDLDEILSGVSSVLVQRASDGLRVSIRGMYDSGTPQYGQSTSTPTVAINTDGVYSSRKDTGSSLYDIERVEVLYGPQSTMYSSNSPGGIVNIVTAQPKTDKYEASGAVEYGNYNLLHTEGSMNVPISESIALRAAFNTNVRDSFISGGAGGEDTKSARLRLLYKPNENFSIMPTAEHSRTGGGAMGGGVTPFIDQDDVDDPWDSTEVTETIGSNDMIANKLSATLTLDMDIGTLTFVPSYSTRSGNNVNTSVGTDPDTEETETTNMYQDQIAREAGMELRMASSSDFLFKWIVGATYYKSKDYQYRASEDYVEDPTTGYYSTSDMNQKARAVFANITYPVLDTTRITGGYRVSWDEMTSLSYDSQMDSLQDAEMENSGKPDYKIGFEYDVAENSMLYGDYSTSYRVTGMKFAAPGDPETKQPPEKLKSFTLGLKNRFFGNKLQLNASAYYYDYSNYAVTDEGQVDLGDELYNDAAYCYADGFLFGTDIQASAIITSKDILNLSASYIKSEWDDLYFDHYYLEDVSYHGVSMANTPDWTVSATYSRNFSLANGGFLKSSITSKYQTSYKLTWKKDDLPYSYQEAHHMEDFSLAYTNPEGKWTLSGYVNNIFNYAEKKFYMSRGTGGGSMTIGDPRTYGGVLSVKF